MISRHPAHLAELIRRSGATVKVDEILAGGAPQITPGAGTQTGEAATLEVVLDGGGMPLAAGIKCDVVVDFDCTVTGWTLLGDQAGSIRIDLWKSTYATFPPVVAGTMPGANANKPQATGAAKAQGGVSGWSASAIAAGEIVRVNVDTVATFTRVTLGLTLRRT
ncbi:MAG TPA: hypothetical protein VFC31_13000 [Candidatus Limnocylindria bacterium]|nr:hypothetical protein [Candidatus Limnocylindria bacterium]